MFQMDRHECEYVVYFAKVSWKGGPSVQPALQAEGVKQMYQELGSGQMLCVGQLLTKVLWRQESPASIL